MNILYYIGTITPKNGGVFQYSLGLLRSLARLEGYHFYVVYGGKQEEVTNLAKEFASITLLDLPSMAGWHRKDYLAKALQLLTKQPVYKPHGPLHDICERYKIDVLHSPFAYLPPSLDVPCISTVHDLQQLHFPQFFSPGQRLDREQVYQDIIARGDIVVTSFEHVRKDIITYFNKPQVQVVTRMIDLSTFLNPTLTEERDIVALDHFKLPEQFIFYPAACWQHKNHLGLLEALALIRDEKGIKINLICTGNNQTEFFYKIEEEVNRLDLSEQVQFLGVVSEREIFSIYHACRAVVVPTMYEATSGPLVEAMFLDVPVTCSNVTALPFTIGDDKYTFDPQDIPMMAKRIMEITQDEKVRQANLDNSRKQQEKLRAPELLEAFKSIYSQAIRFSYKEPLEEVKKLPFFSAEWPEKAMPRKYDVVYDEPREHAILPFSQSLKASQLSRILARTTGSIYLYLTDNFFFCRKGRNHLNHELTPCTRCVGGNYDSAKLLGCYSVYHQLDEYNELATLMQESVKSGKLQLLAQHVGQAKLAAEHFGLKEEEIQVVGVPMGNIHPEDAGKVDPKLIAFAGDMSPSSGLLYAKEVAKLLPEYRFGFEGEAPQWFDSLPNMEFDAKGEFVKKAQLVLAPAMWSNVIDTTVLNCLAQQQKPLATIQQPYAFSEQLPQGIYIDLDTDPKKGAERLKKAIEENWKPETTQVKNWLEGLASKSIWD